MEKRILKTYIEFVIVILCVSGIAFGQTGSDRKLALYGTSGAKAITRSQNDSVGVMTESSGIFTIGTAGGRPILFGYPYTAQTSHTHFYVDGTVLGNYDDTLVSHPLPAPLTDNPHRVGDSIICSWNVAGVEFTQVLVPTYTGSDPQIRIEYRIENTDCAAHVVGLLLFLDTMIGLNDCAPIATPLGYFESEQEFLGEVPSFWQAYEESPFQPPDMLVGQGLLTGWSATPPDVLIYGDFWNYYNIGWEYSFVGGLYSDSAVLLRWNPFILPPGESRTIVTYCGLGIADRTLGEISLSLTFPELINPSECTGFEPDTFVITLLISPEEHMSGALASISTPSFINLLDDILQSIEPTDLPEGAIGTASWRVAVAPTAISEIGSLAIELSAPGYTTTGMERTIEIIASDGLPPEIYLEEPIPSPVTSDSVTIAFRIVDESVINMTSSSVLLDGAEVSFTWANPILSMHLEDLTEGSHTLIVQQISDTFGCEAEPFVNYIEVVYPAAPSAEFVKPSPGVYSSCDEETVIVHFDCPAGFSTEYSEMLVDGSPTPFGEYDDTVITFVSALSEGEHIIIFQAGDILGREDEIGVGFYVDRTPPQFYPGMGTMFLRTPGDELLFYLVDEISGVDESTVGVRVAYMEDTTVIYSGSPGLSYTDSVLILVLSETSLLFDGCSELSVWIFAGDMSSTCGANYIDSLAFSEIVPCTPPTIEVIDPLGITACDTVDIVLVIFDEEGVVAESAWVEFEGIRYNLSSPHLNLFGDTLIFRLPFEGVHSGDLSLLVGGISDTWGNEISVGAVVYITIDRDPPELLSVFPIGMLTGSETVGFQCVDDISGISADGSYIICDGDTMYLGAGMGFDGENLFVPAAFWLSALDGESLTVCAHVIDDVDECDPNAMDTCVDYYVQQSGPASALIAPPGDVYLGCATQSVKILWFDPDELNRADSRISLSGVVYPADAPRFIWLDDTVSFEIDCESADSVMVTLSGVDMLGFTSLAAFVFKSDRTAPGIQSICPLPDSELALPLEVWKIALSDYPAGILWNSISFLVDGDLFTISDDALEHFADTLVFDPNTAEISFINDIDVALYLTDDAYGCPNEFDTSWTYRVFRPDFWWEIIEPMGVSACETVDVKIVFHSNFDIDFSSVRAIAGAHVIPSDHAGDSLLVRIPAEFMSTGVNTLSVCDFADADHGLALDDTVFVPILFDAYPPSIMPLEPSPGEAVAAGSPVIAILSDDYTGVDWDGIVFELNGSTLIPNPENRSSDSLIMFLPQALNGDVEVCITAYDMPDICEPRTSRLCWEFIVPGAGPSVVLLEPDYNVFTHDKRQKLAFRVTGENPIDFALATLDINGQAFGFDSPNISLAEDVLSFIPDEDWFDGDTVNFALTIVDELALSVEEQGKFFCDFSPPVCGAAYPTGVINDMPNIVSIELTDAGVGVDPNSIVFQIEDLFIPYDNYAVTFDGLTAELNLERAGIHLASLETVDVCILAADINTGFGIPNVIDKYCVWFIPVKEGCSVSPRTFTPNGDGFNDFVTFAVYSQGSIEVNIFTLDGALARKIQGESIVTWNAKDTRGRDVPSGAYIYIVESDGRTLCKGTVVIAR